MWALLLIRGDLLGNGKHHTVPLAPYPVSVPTLEDPLKMHRPGKGRVCIMSIVWCLGVAFQCPRPAWKQGPPGVRQKGPCCKPGPNRASFDKCLTGTGAFGDLFRKLGVSKYKSKPACCVCICVRES